MPIDLRLDENHDISLVDGDLVLIDGIDSFAQGLKIRLQMMLGEWFKDERSGVIDPDSTNNIDLINARLREEITLETGYVNTLLYEYDFNAQTRAMTVTFEVETIWGTTQGTQEVLI